MTEEAPRSWGKVVAFGVVSTGLYMLLSHFLVLRLASGIYMHADAEAASRGTLKLCSLTERLRNEINLHRCSIAPAQLQFRLR